MTELICPVCGSSNIVKDVYSEILQDNICGQKPIEKVIYQCNSCGEAGDFFNENEATIDNALSEIKQSFVVNALSDFTAQKISFSSMERALEIPQRTLTKWKNGVSSPTSTGVALLKFVWLYPWLLEVAEKSFDYGSAQKIFMKTALNTMIDQMEFHKFEFKEALMFRDSKSVLLHLQVPIKEDDDWKTVTPPPEMIAVSYGEDGL